MNPHESIVAHSGRLHKHSINSPNMTMPHAEHYSHNMKSRTSPFVSSSLSSSTLSSSSHGGSCLTSASSIAMVLLLFLMAGFIALFGQLHLLQQQSHALLIAKITTGEISLHHQHTATELIVPPTTPPPPAAKSNIRHRPITNAQFQNKPQPTSPRPSPATVAPTVAAPALVEEFPPLMQLGSLYSAPVPSAAASSSSPAVVPNPSPALIHWMTRNIVIGVMGFDKPRIDMIQATWGRYIRRENIFFYADTVVPDNPQVINLKHPRPDAAVTDRRGSAWKILPAVRHMYEQAPADALWFYLCDDDSYPLIHMLSSLATRYDHTEEIYAGESTGQNSYMKGYYQDEEASGTVGRVLNLRYQCTGGGVLFSRAMLDRLVPVLDDCPVFFASDVSLGYCVNEYAGVKEVTPITCVHHAYPRTPEEVQKKYSQSESKLSQALAFHHMKPSFIYEDGIPLTDSAEKYMSDTEQRFYASYIFTASLLRMQSQRNGTVGSAMEWAGLTPGSLLKGSRLTQAKAKPPTAGFVRPLRLAFVNVVQSEEMSSLVSDKPLSLKDKIQRLFFPNQQLKRRSAFPLGLVAPHLFQTDFIHVRASCVPCTFMASAGWDAKNCRENAKIDVAELFERFELTKASRGTTSSSSTDPVSYSEVNWGAYDIIISNVEGFLPPATKESLQRKTAFFHLQPHASVKCDIPSVTPLVKSIAIRDDTTPAVASTADATPATDAPSISFPTASPLLFTFYGLLHVLDRPRDATVDDTTFELFRMGRGPPEMPPIGILADLTDETERKTWASKLAPISQGRIEWMNDLHADVTESDLNPNHLLRVKFYRHASVCLFTQVVDLTSDTNIFLLEQVVLAITSGCFTFFHSSLAQAYPFIASLQVQTSTAAPGSPASTATATATPAFTLDSFISHYAPPLFSNPAQPFPDRLGRVEAGRQKMELNRLMHYQPLDQFLTAAAKQLGIQRGSVTATN